MVLLAETIQARLPLGSDSVTLDHMLEQTPVEVLRPRFSRLQVPRKWT